jgi:hypothetical protein
MTTRTDWYIWRFKDGRLYVVEERLYWNSRSSSWEGRYDQIDITGSREGQEWLDIAREFPATKEQKQAIDGPQGALLIGVVDDIDGP